MLTTSPSVKITQTSKQDEQLWQPLLLFNYYRIALASILLLLFLFDSSPDLLGKINDTLFYLTNMTYLLVASISLYTIKTKKPNFHIQLISHVLIDIFALTTIIYSSGGLTSGLGILLVITIACGSLLTNNRQAIFAASVASLAILLQSIYADLNSTHISVSYTHAGLLGIAFFITSWVSVTLSKRVSESEAKITQHEFDLANLEQLSEYIVQNFPAGIIVIDPNNQTRLANESARYLLRTSAIGKRQAIRAISPALADQVNEWRSHYNNANPTHDHFQPSAFKADESAPEIIPQFTRLGSDDQAGLVIFLEDSTVVTEKLQQVKLAALGRLTASIAHEIRNPLAAISHAAQLLEESPKLDNSDTRLTQIIINHTQKMNTIVQNILQLSRKESSHQEKIDLKEWLIRFRQEFCVTHSLVESQFEIIISSEAAQIYMDSNHLHQIVSNLCENAVIHGSHDQASKSFIKVISRFETKSNEICVDIINSGSEIKPESVIKIFEPFYTTSNAGTGLGLYITRELCEYNKARLNYIPSKPGSCCFRISFIDPIRAQTI